MRQEVPMCPECERVDREREREREGGAKKRKKGNGGKGKGKSGWGGGSSEEEEEEAGEWNGGGKRRPGRGVMKVRFESSLSLERSREGGLRGLREEREKERLTLSLLLSFVRLGLIGIENQPDITFFGE